MDPDRILTPSVPQLHPRLIRQAFLGGPLEDHEDGLQPRGFTFKCREGIGEAFKVGHGSGCTRRDLIALLKGIPGMELRVLYTPPRSGDVRYTLADISNAEHGLGYRI